MREPDDEGCGRDSADEAVKHRLDNGVSGYPQIRLVALAREVYHHLTRSFSPVEAKSPTT